MLASTLPATERFTDRTSIPAYGPVIGKSIGQAVRDTALANRPAWTISRPDESACAVERSVSETDFLTRPLRRAVLGILLGDTSVA